MTGISLNSVPQGSKLILVGDWYIKPGEGWYVACYFLNEDHQPFRRGFPVDLLPALIPGTVYPRTASQNEAKGYTGTFKVSAMSHWEKCSYSDLPSTLRRLHYFSNEIRDQVVYRLEIEEWVYWLPATELARMLFFHSSEVVRAAAYQGNTWQLAKAYKEGWVGKVTFSSNVPASYLNSNQFRKFFAWLLFDSDAEQSFGSIFRTLNEGSYLFDNVERWTFDFQPPDLSACEISWSGYTGSGTLAEQDQCYIREVRSIAGVSTPDLEEVYFSHPDDVLFLEKEPGDSESGEDEKPRKPEPKVSPKEIDPHNPPKASKKRYLVRVSPGGFHFDTEIDLRRSPRQVRALPKGVTPDLEEIQEEETLGITEGCDHGSIPRTDIDNLEKPELVDAPEKIAFFQTMLQHLEANHDWSIETQTGNVPKKRCRTAHLIDNRARKYCHASVRRDDTTVVQVLEIELDGDESLSTFLYRSDNSQETLGQLLDALMRSESSPKRSAMQWKKKFNAEVTRARLYLDHPDKKIKSEAEALESWIARAAAKIHSL